MLITPFEFIFFFGFSSTLLIVMGLLAKKWMFRNVVLALLLLCLAYLHIMLYLIYTQKIFCVPHMFFTKATVVLIIAPLSYFYMQSLIKDKQKLETKDWLHFLPAIIGTIALMPIHFLSADEKRQFIYELIHQKKYILYRLVSLTIISILISYLVVSLKTMLNRIKSENFIHRRMLILLFLLFLWLVSAILALVCIVTLWFPLMKFNSMLITIIVISLYILAQKNPYLIQYVTIKEKKKNNNNNNKNSYLDKVNLEFLDEQLRQIMENEKFYCDEDLTLSKLSDALEVTSHQLSRFLNEHYNKNFNSFINGYRIVEAKKLLVDEPLRNTLSIAYSVGFNSYTAFYNSFRKDTLMSPAEFREKTKSKMVTC